VFLIPSEYIISRAEFFSRYTHLAFEDNDAVRGFMGMKRLDVARWEFDHDILATDLRIFEQNLHFYPLREV